MNISWTIKILPAAIGAALLLSSVALSAAPPFGGLNDVNYSNSLWKQMEAQNIVGLSNPIMSKPYKGAAPHGMILDLFELKMTINGHEGELIVKRNYGGNGLTEMDVINDPAKYLQAVTVMFKREAGYDPENQNWFYVKYDAEGALLKNPKGVPLAGRIAKGMSTGCIACHTAAPGGDYVFNHDRYKAIK